MNRSTLLRKMLDQIDQTYPKLEKDFKYIGTGNPNASILIIGKETSITDNNQKTWEITNNFEDWRTIISKDPPYILNLEEIKYSPFYPYKGQKLKIRNKRTGDNGGTSSTWCNYQKLYNLIQSKGEKSAINFHEGVFITEVNSCPSLKTIDADTKSIEFRKKHILTSEFFQSFPIVIISGLGYFTIDKSQNEIQEIFGVQFIRKECALNKETQAYWIHEGTCFPKLLINTRQLSIGISKALLEGIAKEITESKLML